MWDFSAAEFAVQLDPYMSNGGYRSVTDLPVDVDESDPESISYTYTIGSGVYMYFFADPGTKQVTSISFYIVPSSTDMDALTYYAYLSGVISGVLEPMQSDRDSINSQIDISNLTTSTSQYAGGSNSFWSYTVGADYCSLIILPL